MHRLHTKCVQLRQVNYCYDCNTNLLKRRSLFQILAQAHNTMYIVLTDCRGIDANRMLAFCIRHFGLTHYIPYGQNILRGIKFGGLAVYITTANLKSAKISYLHNYIRMAIPYRIAKFKSANILAIAILGSF